MTETAVRILTITGDVLGLLVVVYGLARFLRHRSIAALLISLGLVVVGPLEDLIKSLVRAQPPLVEEPVVQLVDQATSVILLLLLLAAIHWMRIRNR